MAGSLRACSRPSEMSGEDCGRRRASYRGQSSPSAIRDKCGAGLRDTSGEEKDRGRLAARPRRTDYFTESGAGADSAVGWAARAAAFFFFDWRWRFTVDVRSGSTPNSTNFSLRLP